MTSDKESAQKAAVMFGFSEETPLESLCPYGPVYKLQDRGETFVIKRTGYPRSSGVSIASWLHALSQKNIGVVAPVERYAPNPRKLHASDPFEWVIYPFIEGENYAGKPEQIAAAGKLLGQMHREGAHLGRGMLEDRLVKDLSLEKILTQFEQVLERLDQWAPHEVDQFEGNFKANLAECKRLEPRNLPLVACSWDYKASNIVFENQETPVLVDPDHGGRIPKLYDLACSLVLFHTDHAAGPHRLWSIKEWRTFKGSYEAETSFTIEEQNNWPWILARAWLAEGVWLLANFTEGWEDSRERQYLIDLAVKSLRDYSL